MSAVVSKLSCKVLSSVLIWAMVAGSCSANGRELCSCTRDSSHGDVDMCMFMSILPRALPRICRAKLEARGIVFPTFSWHAGRSRPQPESSRQSDAICEIRVQHFVAAFYRFLFCLLVCVVRRVAMAVLLGFVGCFAIVCRRCGGDPRRSLKQGPAPEFTAAACATVDVRGVDVGNLRFSWMFSETVAAASPGRNNTEISWAAAGDVGVAPADLIEGRPGKLSTFSPP